MRKLLKKRNVDHPAYRWMFTLLDNDFGNEFFAGSRTTISYRVNEIADNAYNIMYTSLYMLLRYDSSGMT